MSILRPRTCWSRSTRQSYVPGRPPLPLPVPGLPPLLPLPGGRPWPPGLPLVPLPVVTPLPVALLFEPVGSGPWVPLLPDPLEPGVPFGFLFGPIGIEPWVALPPPWLPAKAALGTICTAMIELPRRRQVRAVSFWSRRPPLSSSNNTALDRREPTMRTVGLGLATLLSSRWGINAET